MTGETLPGVERAGPERIVLHVDMDCFYASCERLREPELRGKPVVVGMGYEPGEGRGAVATASYEARAFGVESAQPVSKALEVLPRIEDVDGDEAVDGERDGETERAGHYRPVDIDFYKEVAEAVRAIIHECADVVREVSIDEAYLDVTDRTSWQVGDTRTLAEGYAQYVRERIAREVGVPASVGVAPNMSTAKIASDADKPDGLVVVPPDEVEEFLAPLPVEAIHGVGPVTARDLRKRGIETAGDLAAADVAALTAAFGSRGRELRDRARGRDDRVVTPTGRPKSLNREKSLSTTDDRETKRERIGALAADVAERARARGALYRTIGIKVVTPPFEINTRERSLPGPVDDPELVREVALSLLSEFDDVKVRKLGVRVSNLSFADADQSRLDGWDEAPDPTESPKGSTDAGESGGSTEPGESGDSEGAETERGQKANSGGFVDGQAALTDFENDGDDANTTSKRAGDGANTTSKRAGDSGEVRRTLRDFGRRDGE